MAGDWRIERYETAGGGTPVDRALRGLPDNAKKAMAKGLERLAAEGTSLGMPFAKVVSGFEPLRSLRIRAGRDHWRILFFKPEGRRLVLLHVCHRPDCTVAVFRVATERMQDWLRRESDR